MARSASGSADMPPIVSALAGAQRVALGAERVAIGALAVRRQIRGRDRRRERRAGRRARALDEAHELVVRAEASAAVPRRVVRPRAAGRDAAEVGVAQTIE